MMIGPNEFAWNAYILIRNRAPHESSKSLFAAT